MTFREQLKQIVRGNFQYPSGSVKEKGVFEVQADQILALIDREIIGEDEKNYVMIEWEKGVRKKYLGNVINRNLLRKEQREKLGIKSLRETK